MSSPGPLTTIRVAFGLNRDEIAHSFTDNGMSIRRLPCAHFHRTVFLARRFATGSYDFLLRSSSL